jgi:hypothetical protein
VRRVRESVKPDETASHSHHAVTTVVIYAISAHRAIDDRSRSTIRSTFLYKAWPAHLSNTPAMSALYMVAPPWVACTEGTCTPTSSHALYAELQTLVCKTRIHILILYTAISAAPLTRIVLHVLLIYQSSSNMHMQLYPYS